MTFSPDRLSTSSPALRPVRNVALAKSAYVQVSSAGADSPPERALNPRWRAWTLHPISLVITVAFTLAVIAILEYLQRKSDASKGIVFADTRDGIPTGLNFLYLTFPTVIAVLYSIWWSYVDLDVKRLEPWYQLAYPKKETSVHPLLLQYPVEFVAMVPFRAAKRRQWAVAAAASAMVLVFWAVTPLQSAIFRVAPASILRNSTIVTPAGLSSLAVQFDKIGGKLPSSAYGIVWLGQELPPFTTREFSLAPWSLESSDSGRNNASMTADTTLYQADLKCFDPASVVYPKNETSGTLEIDDGQGCTERVDIDDSMADTGNTGFHASVCNKYLIVWATKEAPLTDVSSLDTRLCKTSYFSQPVRANVSVPTGAVLQTWPLGPKKDLAETEFNSTVLEFVILNGLAPREGPNVTSWQDRVPRPFDVSEDTVITQNFKVMQRGFPGIHSILAGIAVGGQNLTFDQFMDEREVRDNAVRRAQQLFFALAVSTISSVEKDVEANHPVTITFSAVSIQLVRNITSVVQGFLALIAVLTTILAVLFFHKFLPFGSDPHSIGFVAALASRHRFLDHFKPLDRVKDLVPLLSDRHAELRQFGGMLAMSMEPVDVSHEKVVNGERSSLTGTKSVEGVETGQYHWPLELQKKTGISVILGLALAAAALITLYRWTEANQGFPLPSNSAAAQQVVLNYVPTVFGTLMEPFLVVVCRILCFIQPFEDLKSRPRPASRTLLQKYTSRPPQLAMLSAIINRHFTLASLSFITILANLLTIALSGVFVIRDITVSSDTDGLQYLAPAVNLSALIGSGDFGNTGNDIIGSNGEPFQLLLSNITAGTPLPPWTTSERYYLPVNVTAAKGSSKYSMTTVGFQGSLKCRAITNSPSDLSYELSLNSDATQIRYLQTEKLSNGTIKDCYPQNAFSDQTIKNENGFYPDTQMFVLGDPSGQKTTETFMIPKTENSIPGLQNKAICSETFVGGWIRSNITLGTDRAITNGPALTENLSITSSPTANTTSVSLDARFISCTATTYAAKYNITINPQNQILNSIELPNSSFPIDPSIAEGAFSSLRSSFANQSPWLWWHSDTLARDWMSFFMTKIADSDSLIDARDSLPSEIELGSRVSDVMQRLFALVLAVNRNTFLPLSDPVPVAIQELSVVARVFLLRPLYIIALTVLFIDILVLGVVYLRLSRPFLPRMPTNIASIVAYLAASQFVKELAEGAEGAEGARSGEGSRGRGGGKGGESLEDTVSLLKESDVRYAFGPFVGTDGNPHVGIERVPLVRPLDEVQNQGRNQGQGQGQGRVQEVRRRKG